MYGIVATFRRACLAAVLVLGLGGCAWFGGEAELTMARRPAGNTVADTARSQIGVPYCWGGETPSQGFDCSGLVQWVYARHGVTLPRRTEDMIFQGFYVARNNIQPGDLVFFNISEKKVSLHVGIATDRQRFIHSPSPGGRVREDSLGAAYWRNSYVQARRLAQ